MKSVIRLLRKYLYIMGERKVVLLSLVGAFLFNASLDVVGIGAFGLFARLLLDPDVVQKMEWLQGIGSWIGLSSNSQYVVFVGLCGLGVIIVKTILVYVVGLYVIRFNTRKRTELQADFHEVYLRAPHSFRLKRNFAEMLFNCSMLPNQFVNGFSRALIDLVCNLILVSVIAIFLAMTNWIATLAVGTFFGLAGVVYYLYIKDRSGRSGRLAALARQNMIKNIRESLGASSEVRILGCENFFTRRSRSIAGEILIHDLRIALFNMIPRPAAEVLLLGFIVFITLFFYLTQGSITEASATLGMFGLAGMRMVPALSTASFCLNSLKSSSFTVHRLYDELKATEDLRAYEAGVQARLRKREVSDNTEPYHYTKAIEIRDLCFRYSDADANVINELTLEIPKGRKVALVGRSGSGKSTLINLLLGQLTPSEGEISVDGRSIYEDLRGWQDLISYLPQSIYILDDTLVRNVAFGVPDDEIDIERVKWAIREAQLDELVEFLADGIYTPLGDQGDRVSGGQRQRIGIARALYHDRQVLVMDEATSALDEETEKQVKEAIRRLGNRVTVIMITHNLRENDVFDDIYRLHEGRIVEHVENDTRPVA